MSINISKEYSSTTGWGLSHVRTLSYSFKGMSFTVDLITIIQV